MAWTAGGLQAEEASRGIGRLCDGNIQVGFFIDCISR